MRKNKLIQIIGFALIAVILFGCSDNGISFNDREMVEISFDEPPVENVEELMEIATHVFRGEVLDRRVEWRDHTITREHWVQRYLSEGRTEDEIDELLYGIDWDEIAQEDPELVTIYRIYLIEVFQGHQIAGDIIEVSRLGGEVDEAYWDVEDEIELEVGSELILFLTCRAWTGWGQFTFSHTYQAVYYVPNSIDDVEITALKDDELDVDLESVNDYWHNDLVITLEDLIEIAEENDLLD